MGLCKNILYIDASFLEILFYISSLYRKNSIERFSSVWRCVLYSIIRYSILDIEFGNIMSSKKLQFSISSVYYAITKKIVT